MTELARWSSATAGVRIDASEGINDMADPEKSAIGTLDSSRRPASPSG